MINGLKRLITAKLIDRQKTMKINEKNYPQPNKLYNLDKDTAYWPEDAEDWIYWRSEADHWAEDYAKSYKVRISPKDYLDLTTVKGADALNVGDPLGTSYLKDLDIDEFNKEKWQAIFLQAAFKDPNNPNRAQVVGHEGRHRMFALMRAGVKYVDIELICDVGYTNYDKYHPFKLDYIELIGQFNSNVSVKVYNPIPMSWKQHKSIRPNLTDANEGLDENYSLEDAPIPLDIWHSILRSEVEGLSREEEEKRLLEILPKLANHRDWLVRLISCLSYKNIEQSPTSVILKYITKSFDNPNSDFYVELDKLKENPVKDTVIENLTLNEYLDGEVYEEPYRSFQVYKSRDNCKEGIAAGEFLKRENAIKYCDEKDYFCVEEASGYDSNTKYSIIYVTENCIFKSGQDLYSCLKDNIFDSYTVWDAYAFLHKVFPDLEDTLIEELYRIVTKGPSSNSDWQWLNELTKAKIDCSNLNMKSRYKYMYPESDTFIESKSLNEYVESETFKPYTAGYIKEDGTLIIADRFEYNSHYGIAEDNPEISGKNYPEFSNTHPEEDTCIRLSLDNEPNAIQYKRLEEIIDKYLDQENYCKSEIWNKNNYIFYKVYSLVEGACGDYSWEEDVGNWTGYKIVNIIKNFYANPENNKLGLNESLLLEKTRNELISKSKKSDNYSKNNQHKGRNRWERRVHSRVANTVRDYNRIDMDAFFKTDILDFIIKVQGETNDYDVTITFEEALKEIADQIKRNNNNLEFKCVLRGLISAFNRGNVYVNCTCPDFTYRQAYWATKGQYNSGMPQPSNGKQIANPGDTKGAGCKHVNLVLANLDWMMKIASVINNYIYWARDNLENQYAKFIFPVIYEMPYDKAIQMTIDMYDENGELKPEYTDDKLHTSQDIINMSNMIGRQRGQYKKKPEKSINPRYGDVHPRKEQPKDDGQMQLDIDNNEEEEQTGPQFDFDRK